MPDIVSFIPNLGMTGRPELKIQKLCFSDYGLDTLIGGQFPIMTWDSVFRGNIYELNW